MNIWKNDLTIVSGWHLGYVPWLHYNSMILLVTGYICSVESRCIFMVKWIQKIIKKKTYNWIIVGLENVCPRALDCTHTFVKTLLEYCVKISDTTTLSQVIIWLIWVTFTCIGATMDSKNGNFNISNGVCILCSISVSQAKETESKWEWI